MIIPVESYQILIIDLHQMPMNHCTAGGRSLWPSGKQTNGPLQNLFDLRDFSWLAQASHPASRSCSVAVNSSHAGLPVPGLRSLRSCPAGAAAAAGWGAAEGAVTAAAVDSGAEGDTPFAGGKKRNSVMISDGERGCFLCASMMFNPKLFFWFVDGIYMIIVNCSYNI